MFVIKGIRADHSGIWEEEIDDVSANLENRGLRPLFRSMADAAEWASGLDRGTLSWGDKGKADLAFSNTIRDPYEDAYTGEIFFNNNTLLVIHATYTDILCFGIAHFKQKRKLDRILKRCASVVTQVKQVYNNKHIVWTPWEVKINRSQNPRNFCTPRKILQSHEKVKFRNFEVVAAETLAIPEARKTLIRIKQGGRTADADTAILSCLTGVALLRRKANDAYFLTKLGEDLIEKSRWMEVWITSQLIRGGAHPRNIQWEVGNKGDQVDIMLDVYGIRTLFEIKSEDFNSSNHLTNFLGRIDHYKGDRSVIATTGKMDESLKSIAQERLGERIEIWEGENSIEKMARTYPARASIEAFCECVKIYPPRRYLDIEGVIRKWATGILEQNMH